MNKIISILIFVSLIGLNAYIFLSTEKKLENYIKSPPFQMNDFTKSNRKNNNSNIKNLTDKDKNTFWIKEQKSNHPEYDFELELTLTHFYENSVFRKKQFHNLSFYFCPMNENNLTTKVKNRLKVDIFLREAINIDKELRLPNDNKIASFEIENSGKEPSKISMEKLFNLTDSKEFPENIFILTLFVKEIPSETNPVKVCIAEVEVD